MTENPIGWAPWATATPKEYFGMFVASGGPNQLVLIEDNFPKIEHSLTDATQRRLANTMSLFIRQVGGVMSYSPQIVTASTEMGVSDYLGVRSTSIQGLKEGMPPRLMTIFDELNVQEVLRAIAHVADVEYLVHKRHVPHILSSSAQKNMALLTPQASFTFITTNRSVPEHLKKTLNEGRVNSTMDLLSLWNRANILRGPKLERKIASELTNSKNESAKMATSLSEDFVGQKRLALLIPPADVKNPENIFVVISKTIKIPEHLSTTSISKETVERFEQNQISLAHIECNNDGVPVNLLFINAEEAENLYLNDGKLNTISNSDNDFLARHGLDRDKIGSLILSGSLNNQNSEFIGIKLGLLEQIKNSNKPFPGDLPKSVEPEISALKQILEMNSELS